MQQGLHTTLSGWAHGILHGILPILDLRTPDRYLQERLVGAANVPAGDLSDKVTPFGVVLPAGHDGQASAPTDDSRLNAGMNDGRLNAGQQEQVASTLALPGGGEQQGDVPSTQVPMGLKGCSSLQEFLESRHWVNVKFYLTDSQELWQAARDLGLWEGQEVPASVLRKRFLFQPCPLLAQEVNLIEQLLADRALRDGRCSACSEDKQGSAAGGSLQPRPAAQRGSPAGQAAGIPGQQDLPLQQQQQQQQQCHPQQAQVLQQMQAVSICDRDEAQLQRSTTSGGYAAKHVRLRMLEPGCGSARNMAWLAARASLVTCKGPPLQSGADAQPSQEQPQQQQLQEHGQEEELVQVTWEALGLDFTYSALLRTQELFTFSGIPPDQAQLWFVDISQETGELKPLTTNRSGQEHNTHVVLPSPDTLPQESFDLIVCVRFLERSFLRHIPSLLAPGGILLYSTFLDMPGTRKFGRPKGDRHLLQRNELHSMFGPTQGFQVIKDDVTVISDGRELSEFIARKL